MVSVRALVFSLYLVACNSHVTNQQQPPDYSKWDCQKVRPTLSLAVGADWNSYLCNAKTKGGNVEDMVINVVSADLSVASLKAVPVQATANFTDPSYPYLLQSIPDMAHSSNKQLIAGINGGYFWRTDSSSFIDWVCIGKTKEMAMQPVSSSNYDLGTGDVLLIVNGTVLSNSCNCWGQGRPASLVIDGMNTEIVVQHRASPPLPHWQNVIASGPDILRTNPATGVSTVGVPKGTENWGNVFEHSANTGVGLKVAPSAAAVATTTATTGKRSKAIGQGKAATRSSSSGKSVSTDKNDSNNSNNNNNSSKSNTNGSGPPYQTMFLVTTDGHDGCSHLNATCGMNSFQLGYFMRDFLGAQAGMNMDQGGSTQMWIQKEEGNGNQGVVSNLQNKGGQRHVYDGLFLCAGGNC